MPKALATDDPKKSVKIRAICGYELMAGDGLKFFGLESFVLVCNPPRNFSPRSINI